MYEVHAVCVLFTIIMHKVLFVCLFSYKFETVNICAILTLKGKNNMNANFGYKREVNK